MIEDDRHLSALEHLYYWVYPAVMVATMGFESVTALGEEAVNPKRDIPRGVLLSLTIQGLFCYLIEYFAANYFLNSAYSLADAKGSAAPIGDMMLIIGNTLLGGHGEAFMLGRTRQLEGAHLGHHPVARLGPLRRHLLRTQLEKEGQSHRAGRQAVLTSSALKLVRIRARQLRALLGSFGVSRSLCSRLSDFRIHPCNAWRKPAAAIFGWANPELKNFHSSWRLCRIEVIHTCGIFPPNTRVKTSDPPAVSLRSPVMTRKEAIRRLERLALENGHKRRHYIKRALVEFLESREALLLGERRPRVDGAYRALDPIAARLSKFPN
jgi:hypothetical protein